MKAKRYNVGIDEAGRGSIAGPVYVGAVAIPSFLKVPFRRRDSKMVSEKEREDIYKWMEVHPDIIMIKAYTSPQRIDKEGITSCVNDAAQRCIDAFMKKNKYEIRIVTDAGISIKGYTYKSFPRADESVRSVSLASVVAKVSRDRYMKRIHSRYSKYGMDMHKGYGTSHHESMIRRYGISKIHRLTFTKKFHTLSEHVTR